MVRKARFLLSAFVALLSTCLNRISFVSADITPILIVTNSTIPRNRTSYYESRVSNTTDPVNITITSDFSYFIVQVHTFDKVVSLSNGSNFKRGSYVSGKDVGLVQPIVPETGTYNFYLNDFNQQVEYVVAVIPYGLLDPTPGGCLKKSQPVPYLQAAYNTNIVRITFQNATVGIDCENDGVKLEMYYLYFSLTYNKTSYFDSLRKMATVKDIELNGVKVPSAKSLHRSYVNYIGTGRIFVVVAYWKNYSAAYVPVVSYGCNFGTESCHEGKAIQRALAAFYLMIALTAMCHSEKLTALFCTMTCCFHIIVPLVSNTVSVLTVSISLMVITLAVLALYYFKYQDVTLTIAAFVIGCCFVHMWFGYAAISQVTIYYWLVHLGASILYFAMYKVDPKPKDTYTVLFILGILFCCSIFSGRNTEYVITNVKFYFTFNYYQPVIAYVT